MVSGCTFSSNAENGFHIWRQRYPDGAPEQITFGPGEQEGTAISEDGKALITSMGTQLATISLHDLAGERPLTSETFAMLPTFAPSVGRVFYLVRSVSARAYASGELWSVDLDERTKGANVSRACNGELFDLAGCKESCLHHGRR